MSRQNLYSRLARPTRRAWRTGSATAATRRCDGLRGNDAPRLRERAHRDAGLGLRPGRARAARSRCASASCGRSRIGSARTFRRTWCARAFDVGGAVERGADARPARGARAAADRPGRVRRGRRARRDDSDGRRRLHANLRDAPIQCQNDNPAATATAARPRSSAARAIARTSRSRRPKQAQGARRTQPVRLLRRGPGRRRAIRRTTRTTRRGRYATSFVGNECMLTLAANSCDLDADAAVRGAGRPALPVPHPRAARRRSASAAWRSR